MSSRAHSITRPSLTLLGLGALVLCCGCTRPFARKQPDYGNFRIGSTAAESRGLDKLRDLLSPRREPKTFGSKRQPGRKSKLHRGDIQMASVFNAPSGLTLGQPNPATDPPPLQLPAEPGPRIQIPLRPNGAGNIQIRQPQAKVAAKNGGKISLSAEGARLDQVVRLIAEKHGLSVVAATPLDAPVSFSLKNVEVEEALTSVLAATGHTWYRRGNIVTISKVSAENNLGPSVQGKAVQVFPLDYVAADDVEKVVTGLLSPAGKVLSTKSKLDDQLKTREEIVVEDLPDYLSRVERYIAQVDVPPRQVMIEARVLQVQLSDTQRHGVNLSSIASLAGTRLNLQTSGLANAAASPSFFLGLDGSDLDGFVEALQATSDAKTLASPRVMAVNGQQAKIQIGGRLGYLVTTTTQTATLQNVEFLDVGVVLNVTPRISRDGRVMMTVKPEVSSGNINPQTGLPEEETTEVQTSVLLPDGKGLVIGGLIQEADIDDQSKVPVVGDLFGVGRLFQRRSTTRSRTEIIVVLVPRVVPYGCGYKCRDEQNFNRAMTPLFDGPLNRTYRPWEPQLPDAVGNPRRFNRGRLKSLRNINDRRTAPVLGEFLPLQ